MVPWPQVLSNLNMLNRKWLFSKQGDRIDLCHSKLIEFERHLKSYRLRNSDNIEAMDRTNLPFQAETHISEKFNLAWADSSAKVVYVELRG